MKTITKQQVDLILKIGLAKIGQKYEKGFNCITFVSEIYKEVGISFDFSEHPRLSIEDIYKNEFIGYLCFLKHKKHGQEKRFTHIGIIAPSHHLLHYSRYFGEPNIREVFLTSFDKIFEVYNFTSPEF